MPLYNFYCHNCVAAQDIFSSVADRDAPVYCGQCQGLMQRRVAAPMVRGDYPGYTSPVDGRWIEGRKAHREDLARHGCRILEPGETKAFEHRKAREEEAFLERVADSAARSVMQMPTAKREQLARELDSGADVNYSRNAV